MTGVPNLTEEQRAFCLQLGIYPNEKQKIGKDEFQRRFPSALEHGKLAVSLLEQAYEAKDADDLECAMIVGATFGFNEQHASILCRLLEVDWHHSHEDVISALDRLRCETAVEALFQATQWVPKSLQYDDSRALAVKAIWALGNLNGSEAELKLQELARADNAILRTAAVEQLARRHRLTHSA